MRSPLPYVRRSASRRRGAMLPLIGILLPVLLILLGFSVDLAYMQTTRLELQAAADSAARAGATKLSQNGTASEARTAAKNLAQMNTVAGVPLLLRDSEIEVGRSDLNAQGRWVFTNGGAPANAVHVNANRTAGSLGGPVPLFFGSFIGTQSFQPVQLATASFLNVDICLVLDRSSSMKLNVTGETGGLTILDRRFCTPPNAASRWKALDAAVRVFLQELADTDALEQVALASYSSDLSGYRPALCGASSSPSSLDAPLSTDLNVVGRGMDGLLTSVWNGNTYIEAGMRTGLAALQDRGRARTNALKVMILLTDGNENVGRAMDAAVDCAAAEVVVHTITFSDDANQTTMRNVAQATGGQHYHAESAEELREIFRALAAQSTRLTE